MLTCEEVADAELAMAGAGVDISWMATRQPKEWKKVKQGSAWAKGLRRRQNWTRRRRGALKRAMEAEASWGTMRSGPWEARLDGDGGTRFR